MKSGIHPDMHPVVFVDGDHEYVTLSTLTSSSKREIDGVEHFVIPIDISSATHPFFTGEQRIIDTAGQVERFMRRLEAGVSQREEKAAKKAAKRKAALEAKRKRRGLTPIEAPKKSAKKQDEKKESKKGDED